jgi:hypothetical protein
VLRRARALAGHANVCWVTLVSRYCGVQLSGHPAPGQQQMSWHPSAYPDSTDTPAKHRSDANLFHHITCAQFMVTRCRGTSCLWTQCHSFNFAGFQLAHVQGDKIIQAQPDLWRVHHRRRGFCWPVSSRGWGNEPMLAESVAVSYMWKATAWQLE